MSHKTKIETTLHRRIAAVGAARQAAHERGDIDAWKRAADRGGRLRDALIAILNERRAIA